MSAVGLKRLTDWIEKLAGVIAREDEPDFNHLAPFLSKPELAFYILDMLFDLTEEDAEHASSHYSACVYALDVCMTQLKYTKDSGGKLANKIVNNIMTNIADLMQQQMHSLNFWLPVLNIFYLAKIEMSEDLKDAYMTLASEEEDEGSYYYDQEDVRETIREQIQDASDLSIFEIAEIFFAQGHAMTADFFADLMVDLYNIEEGHDIALLLLLHPKDDVRAVVTATFDSLIKKITLSAASLMRLKIIRDWYPCHCHTQFDYWVRVQEMKGVVAQKQQAMPLLKIDASEVDGRGSQGIFIHIKTNKQYFLCGMLLKQGYGIKDVWITPAISSAELAEYNEKINEVNLTIRSVTLNYFQALISHFLEGMIKENKTPDLQLLQIQELLGISLKPKALEPGAIIEHLIKSILPPITSENLEASFKRSSAWIHKPFTESWYMEDANIDVLVNQHASIVKGVKVCAVEEAVVAVFQEVFEPKRQQWLFHFLWFALWANAKPSKRDKFGVDSALIAHSIYTGMPLKDIPLMQKICHETVINSIETMNERRTYLTPLG
ncbi:MAG: hypothetical protein H2069_02075 [Legionella sp.]|nr:hypothetical protein [Legionella sp.]